MAIKFGSIVSLLKNKSSYIDSQASQVAIVVKNLPTSAKDIRGAGLIPGLGRPLGGGHRSPLQYSGLENPMDRGAWWAMVHRVTHCGT